MMVREKDKCVALHKDQHTIMECLIDHGYGSINIGTKVCHFLQRMKDTELEAAVNIVIQPEKYGKDFDVTVS